MSEVSAKLPVGGQMSDLAQQAIEADRRYLAAEAERDATFDRYLNARLGQVDGGVLAGYETDWLLASDRFNRLLAKTRASDD